MNKYLTPIIRALFCLDLEDHLDDAPNNNKLREFVSTLANATMVKQVSELYGEDKKQRKGTI